MMGGCRSKSQSAQAVRWLARPNKIGVCWDFASRPSCGPPRGSIICPRRLLAVWAEHACRRPPAHVRPPLRRGCLQHAPRFFPPTYYLFLPFYSLEIYSPAPVFTYLMYVTKYSTTVFVSNAQAIEPQVGKD